MRRPVPLLLGCLVVALFARAEAHGDESMSEKVGRLLHAAGARHAVATNSDAVWAELDELGWARVLPHIDMRKQESAEARTAALEFARRMGGGPGLYHVCLQAIRAGGQDEDIALAGIALLEDALFTSEVGVYAESAPHPLSFDAAWWPELLLELHRSKVFIIETFYSGPGWPASNLTELLVRVVHGQELHLVEVTRHADWRVRMMAVPFLAATRRGRTPAVQAALRQALLDVHPKVRQMAARAIDSCTWHALLPAVGARLLDPGESVAVRIEAAGVFGNTEQRELSVRYLIPALSSQPAAVRAAAAAAAAWLPRSAPLLRALLGALTDPDVSVREGAAKGIGWGWEVRLIPLKVRTNIPALVGLLDTPSPIVRDAVCRILAERGAVPPARALELAQWMAQAPALAARGAAVALASLRGDASVALPLMRTALDRTWRTDRDAAMAGGVYEAAIEAVEMAAYPAPRVAALLASRDGEQRRRAVREWVRRRDDARLVLALAHADPEVVIEAALYLAASDVQTAAVVGAVLRVNELLTCCRTQRVFLRLGARLAPHVPQVMSRYRRRPSDRLYALVAFVDILESPLCDVVWQAFLKAPEAARIKRVVGVAGPLMPRVLGALRSKDPALRHAAALVVAQVPLVHLTKHGAALLLIHADLKAGDRARAVLGTRLEEEGVGQPLAPAYPLIELR